MSQTNGCTPVALYTRVQSLVAVLFCLAVVILAGCAQESGSNESEPVLVGLITRPKATPSSSPWPRRRFSAPRSLT